MRHGYPTKAWESAGQWPHERRGAQSRGKSPATSVAGRGPAAGNGPSPPPPVPPRPPNTAGACVCVWSTRHERPARAAVSWRKRVRSSNSSSSSAESGGPLDKHSADDDKWVWPILYIKNNTKKLFFTHCMPYYE